MSIVDNNQKEVKHTHTPHSGTHWHHYRTKIWCRWFISFAPFVVLPGAASAACKRLKFSLPLAILWGGSSRIVPSSTRGSPSRMLTERLCWKSRDHAGRANGVMLNSRCDTPCYLSPSCWSLVECLWPVERGEYQIVCGRLHVGMQSFPYIPRSIIGNDHFQIQIANLTIWVYRIGLLVCDSLHTFITECRHVRYSSFVSNITVWYCYYVCA